MATGFRTTADCTSAFSRLGRRRRTKDRIAVTLTEHTYFPEGEIGQGWFPNVLAAFQILAQRFAVKRVAIHRFGSIGVGSALDSIAALEIFAPKEIVVTDLHNDVVATAKQNILSNSTISIDVHAFVSDLCTSLIAKDMKVDLLYENLPNLPANMQSMNNPTATASFFRRDDVDLVPAVYSKHRLILHYLFLCQSHTCLADSGSVICCIGSRIPPSIVRSMFHECQFQPDVLNFNMVRQFESEKVLAGYAQAELAGDVSFRFFPFQEGTLRLQDLKRQGANLDDLYEDVRMKQICLSATEAKAMEATGEAIGHIGVVWGAVPLETIK